MNHKTIIRLNTVNEQEKNKIAYLIKMFALFTYIGGFIFGCIVAYTKVEYNGLVSSDFSWIKAFLIWIISFYSGTLLYGYSEIINILQAIKFKSYRGEFEENIEQNCSAKNSPKDESKVVSTNNFVNNSSPIEVIKDSNSLSKVAIFQHRSGDKFICPECKNIQRPDRKVCWKCGTIFKFKNEKD